MSKKLYPFRVPHFLAIFGARDEPRSSGMPMPASPASATNRRVETREPIEIIMACEAGRISIGEVGGTGLEPVTPSLSSWCSPN